MDPAVTTRNPGPGVSSRFGEKTYYCETCKLSIMGREDYSDHLASMMHRLNLQRKTGKGEEIRETASPQPKSKPPESKPKTRESPEKSKEDGPPADPFLRDITQDESTIRDELLESTLRGFYSGNPDSSRDRNERQSSPSRSYDIDRRSGLREGSVRSTSRNSPDPGRTYSYDHGRMPYERSSRDPVQRSIYSDRTSASSPGSRDADFRRAASPVLDAAVRSSRSREHDFDDYRGEYRRYRSPEPSSRRYDDYELSRSYQRGGSPKRDRQRLDEDGRAYRADDVYRQDYGRSVDREAIRYSDHERLGSGDRDLRYPDRERSERARLNSYDDLRHSDPHRMRDSLDRDIPRDSRASDVPRSRSQSDRYAGDYLDERDIYSKRRLGHADTDFRDRDLRSPPRYERDSRGSPMRDEPSSSRDRKDSQEEPAIDPMSVIELLKQAGVTDDAAISETAASMISQVLDGNFSIPGLTMGEEESPPRPPKVTFEEEVHVKEIAPPSPKRKGVVFPDAPSPEPEYDFCPETPKPTFDSPENRNSPVMPKTPRPVFDDDTSSDGNSPSVRHSKHKHNNRNSSKPTNQMQHSVAATLNDLQNKYKQKEQPNTPAQKPRGVASPDQIATVEMEVETPPPPPPPPPPQQKEPVNPASQPATQTQPEPSSDVPNQTPLCMATPVLEIDQSPAPNASDNLTLKSLQETNAALEALRANIAVLQSQQQANSALQALQENIAALQGQTLTGGALEGLHQSLAMLQGQIIPPNPNLPAGQVMAEMQEGQKIPIVGTPDPNQPKRQTYRDYKEQQQGKKDGDDMSQSGEDENGMNPPFPGRGGFRGRGWMDRGRGGRGGWGPPGLPGSPGEWVGGGPGWNDRGGYWGGRPDRGWGYRGRGRGWGRGYMNEGGYRIGRDFKHDKGPPDWDRWDPENRNKPDSRNSTDRDRFSSKSDGPRDRDSTSKDRDDRDRSRDDKSRDNRSREERSRDDRSRDDRSRDRNDKDKGHSGKYTIPKAKRAVEREKLEKLTQLVNNPRTQRERLQIRLILHSHQQRKTLLPKLTGFARMQARRESPLDVYNAGGKIKLEDLSDTVQLELAALLEKEIEEEKEKKKFQPPEPKEPPPEPKNEKEESKSNSESKDKDKKHGVVRKASPEPEIQEKPSIKEPPKKEVEKPPSKKQKIESLIGDGKENEISADLRKDPKVKPGKRTPSLSATAPAPKYDLVSEILMDVKGEKDDDSVSLETPSKTNVKMDLSSVKENKIGLSFEENMDVDDDDDDEDSKSEIERKRRRSESPDKAAGTGDATDDASKRRRTEEEVLVIESDPAELEEAKKMATQTVITLSLHEEEIRRRIQVTTSAITRLEALAKMTISQIEVRKHWRKKLVKEQQRLRERRLRILDEKIIPESELTEVSTLDSSTSEWDSSSTVTAGSINIKKEPVVKDEDARSTDSESSHKDVSYNKYVKDLKKEEEIKKSSKKKKTSYDRDRDRDRERDRDRNRHSDKDRDRKVEKSEKKSEFPAPKSSVVLKSKSKQSQDRKSESSKHPISDLTSPEPKTPNKPEKTEPKRTDEWDREKGKSRVKSQAIIDSSGSDSEPESAPKPKAPTPVHKKTPTVASDSSDDESMSSSKQKVQRPKKKSRILPRSSGSEDEEVQPKKPAKVEKFVTPETPKKRRGRPKKTEKLATILKNYIHASSSSDIDSDREKKARPAFDLTKLKMRPVVRLERINVKKAKRKLKKKGSSSSKTPKKKHKEKEKEKEKDKEKEKGKGKGSIMDILGELSPTAVPPADKPLFSDSDSDEEKLKIDLSVLDATPAKTPSTPPARIPNKEIKQIVDNTEDSTENKGEAENGDGQNEGLHLKISGVVSMADGSDADVGAQEGDKKEEAMEVDKEDENTGEKATKNVTDSPTPMDTEPSPTSDGKENASKQEVEPPTGEKKDSAEGEGAEKPVSPGSEKSADHADPQSPGSSKANAESESDPKSPKPETPSEPHSPGSSKPPGSPSEPETQSQASQDRSAPASPDRSAPASPDRSAPASPDRSAPASPDRSAPASPDRSGPQSPGSSKSAVSKDDDKDSASSVSSELETPKSMKGFRPLQYKGHTDTIHALCIWKTFLFTASEDQIACKFDIKTAKCLATYEGHKKGIQCITVSSGHTETPLVFTGSFDNSVRGYNIENSERESRHKFAHRVYCFHELAGKLYIGLGNGSVSILDVEVDKIVDTFRCADAPIKGLASGEEGDRKLLVVASNDCSITVRDITSGLLLRTIEGHTKAPMDLKVVNNLIYSTGADKTMQVHSLFTGELEQTLNHKGVVTSVCLYEDMLLTAGYEGLVRCYNLKGFDQDQLYYGAGHGIIMAMVVTDNKIITGNKEGLVEAYTLDRTQCWACQFGLCTMVFGLRAHLEHHVVHDHLSSQQETVRCLWTDCTEFLSTKDGAKDAVAHFAEHFNKMAQDKK